MIALFNVFLHVLKNLNMWIQLLGRPAFHCNYSCKSWYIWWVKFNSFIFAKQVLPHTKNLGMNFDWIITHNDILDLNNFTVAFALFCFLARRRRKSSVTNLGILRFGWWSWVICMDFICFCCRSTSSVLLSSNQQTFIHVFCAPFIVCGTLLRGLFLISSGSSPIHLLNHSAYCILFCNEAV